MRQKETRSFERRSILAMAGSVAAGATLLCADRSAMAKAPKTAILKQGPATVEVDDIKVYCEVRGNGPLMILLNGMWFNSFANSFGLHFMTALAQHFTVLTFDQRGQGRTSAGRGSVSYGRFAADTVRLMDVLGIDRANFIGHSDGGCIQLNLLLDFSDRVSTSTLLGTPYSHDAYTSELRALFTQWFEDMKRGEDSKSWIVQPTDPNAPPWWSELKKQYQVESPNPERFDEIRLKNRNCWAVEPNISLRQLAAIDRPVLVIQSGKDEYIPAEQFKILADNIPRAKMVSYPEMTHMDLSPYYKEISQAVSDFVHLHGSKV